MAEQQTQTTEQQIRRALMARAEEVASIVGSGYLSVDALTEALKKTAVAVKFGLAWCEAQKAHALNADVQGQLDLGHGPDSERSGFSMTGMERSRI